MHRTPRKAQTGVSSSLFLLLELLLVEGKLLALQHVTIATAALPGPGRDGGEQPTVLKLLLHHGVELLPGLARLELEDHVTALLLLLLLLVLATLLGTLLALLAQVNAKFLQVPLLVRLRINLHDGILRQGLRAHQLVAGCAALQAVVLE